MAASEFRAGASRGAVRRDAMRSRTFFVGVIAVAAVGLASGSLRAQDATWRVSVTSAGVQGTLDSERSAISFDGRWVAFDSHAANLVAMDTNLCADIFVRDLQIGTTERVSLSSAGKQGNGGSFHPAISADGRFVAFDSAATGLVSGDTNFVDDIFVRDRQTGTTERVSIDSRGFQANGKSDFPAISADGRYVAFFSIAGNLVAGDTNSAFDIFVHDRQTGTTEVASVDSTGTLANASSEFPALSADGRFVEYNSFASNLVAGDVNGTSDVFVHDRQTGTTEMVSVDSSGVQGNNQSLHGALSADGRYVVFRSDASNLVANDTNGAADIFAHDRTTGVTELMSVDSTGVPGNQQSKHPAISGDGRFVAFRSDSTNLVAGDTNNYADVFLHDRSTGATERVSVDSNGAQGNNISYWPTLSMDGRRAAFGSYASSLVSGDTNVSFDVFVHGPYLTLEADPAAPAGGATITFTTWMGGASAPCMLVATDINGTPVFVPAVISTFDNTGVWRLSATVPAGLTGNVITFETYGFDPTGKIDVSNPFAVSFQ
jgi:Tol biopolymer transport system component